MTMRMRSQSGFVTIRTEGGLIPPELLGRVAAGDSELVGIEPTAYHLTPGERRNEAINRSWSRLTGVWQGFRDELDRLPKDDPATSLTRQRWLLVLFQELGYGQLQSEHAIGLRGKSFPVSHAWNAVPIHLVGANIGLDTRTEGVAGAARTSPHGLVQELLNASDERLWGFVSNGRLLRLLRDNVSLTRQAYLEFDLEAMFDGQVYADFVVLWLVCHESRIEGEPPEKCILEQWVNDAAALGTRALDKLRAGVESAIADLGSGFLKHPQNADLRAALRAGELDAQDYYRELLRLVYRLLFLFVAEDRDLLLRRDADLTARARYEQFYATTRMRTLAQRRRGNVHGDLWVGLRLVMAALGRDEGEPALALSGLGSFLWSQDAVPHLEPAELSNESLLRAVRALTTVRDGTTTRSVDYRNLGAEELGGIYESLLELHPEINSDSGSFELRSAAGNERKETGSYYTPTPLINELLDSALEPVLDQAMREHNREAALLAVTVLDPACGSGHFLIAAAHRIARRLASVRTGDVEPSPEAHRAALRDVVGRCLHGIDMNDMAVELCKVSLWMEAVEPGKPLSFLEHRIARGNALLGATPKLLAGGVPDAAFKALEGDDKDVVKSLKARNKKERGGQTLLSFGAAVADLARPVAEAIAEIDALTDDEILALHEKEQRWRELRLSSEAERARLAADAWCAAFVSRKVKGAPVVTEGVVRQIADSAESADSATIDEVRSLRDQYRFLHLHLAFPDVFSVPSALPENEKTGWNGGFSVVIGNPPWERVKLQEKEFFAGRAPEIAGAPNAAARKKLIAALEDDDPALFTAFKTAVRHAEGESHLLRDSARFPLGGRGDVNTYAVFAENFRDAIGRTGRCGMVVPTGIATDDTTKHLFADLVDHRSLVSLFDFENRNAIFPGVHRSYKFSLMTLSGLAAPIDEAEFAFFAYSTADLADPERRFTLSTADFRLLNPNTLTCPVFRTRRDAEITKAIYRRVPVLVREGDRNGNPWDLTFQRMFDPSTDPVNAFLTADELVARGASGLGPVRAVCGERWLRLYEAKMTGYFDHRAADVVFSPTALVRQGQPDEISDLEKRDPARVAEPRYWVRASAVGERTEPSLTWLLGFRDLTSATNERTTIAVALPRSGVTDTIQLAHGGAEPRAMLIAVLNSFALDFVARQKVAGLHLRLFTAKQLPVIPPQLLWQSVPWSNVDGATWVCSRVLELTYTAWDMVRFGQDLGVNGPPYRWHNKRRELLRAELDACFFHLYGIERDDLDYIMETFPIVRRKDEAAHGEYRTKRLILECYDAMAKAIGTGELYQTILDPPPADPSLCHPESTRPDWADS